MSVLLRFVGVYTLVTMSLPSSCALLKFPFPKSFTALSIGILIHLLGIATTFVESLPLAMSCSAARISPLAYPMYWLRLSSCAFFCSLVYFGGGAVAAAAAFAMIT